MQDLIEAYLSVYDDINEVKGFGGRVDPKTGKYTGEVSSPSQKVFQKFSKDAQTHGRQAVSSARSRSITHGEPNESGVVRSQARGTDVTKQDPGLAMTPADRMKARANALEKRGQGKRANKIRAVMNRPNMEESYVEIDEKRLVPGTPDRAHRFPLTDEEREIVERIRKEREKKDKKTSASSTTKSASRKPTTKLSKIRIGESYDFYDLVLDHLLDEGYCESEENAISMMASMSEEWVHSIVEAFVDPENDEAPSGRTPMQNIEDKPKKVRKKAIKGFENQMEKEYGGKWKYQQR